MAVIPFPHYTQYEQFGMGNSGFTQSPQVAMQPDYRESQVLQADGKPYLVGVKRFKMGFDLCRQS